MRYFSAVALALLAAALVVAPVEAEAGGGQKILDIDTAAGTALTNSTTETVLASHVLPANSLQKFQEYEIATLVRATATNGTDTLRVRLRIGATTLTGTVVADSTAVDVADNDVVSMRTLCDVRSHGTAGSMVCYVVSTILGAEGTVTARAAFEVLTSLDTTAALRIEVTGVWSAASASDSAQSEGFVVIERT